VFHDATLREMAARRPPTLGQFAELPGVGQAKLARYGSQFIAAIAEFSAEYSAERSPEPPPHSSNL
ncbi:MAG: HRDC domain-containing protein, partial [Steroidobacteraceae bacterium]